MKRTFIAVNVIPDISFRNSIRKIQNRFSGREIRWADPSNLHVTLRFLGDTSPEEIYKTNTVLSGISQNTSPFDFICKGLGIFRSISYPKVLWVGIRNAEELIRIKMEIDYGLDIENDDKSFSPHLTLGRIQRDIDKNDLRALIDEYKDFEFIKVSVKEIIFFESILQKEGAQYHVISCHPISDTSSFNDGK